MLVDTLRADWTARGTTVRVSALPEFVGGALTLGAGTKLAEARANRREDAAEGERAVALVSVALGRPLDASASAHVRRALAKARDGNAPLALTHLALAGAGRLTEPREDARRLFIADGLMKAGVAPATILAALSAPSAPTDLNRAYKPDQPRVPAGNGRPSGQWTSGDWASDREQPTDLEHPTSSVAPPSAKPIQIADASENWAQYINPIESAEAAERTGAPFNGVGPNDQHARAVAESEANFASLGLIILNRGKSMAVAIPGFPTPRIYDFVALNPETGELVGVEVKSTQFDAIFLNLFQVEKDVAVYTLGGVDVNLPPLGVYRLTSVAYDAACDGCETLRVRTYYLRFRLWLAGIKFYARDYIWRGGQ